MHPTRFHSIAGSIAIICMFTRLSPPQAPATAQASEAAGSTDAAPAQREAGWGERMIRSITKPFMGGTESPAAVVPAVSKKRDAGSTMCDELQRKLEVRLNEQR